MSTYDDIDRPLTEALRALAADERTLGASEAVKERLERQVASLRPVTVTARTRRVTAAVYAAAAAVTLAVMVPVWEASRAPRTTDVVAASAAPQEIATAYVPLTYSMVPFTGGQVVRLTVPRRAVARFGLAPLDALDSSSGTVLADVLVGDDGLARAVRFVEP